MSGIFRVRVNSHKALFFSMYAVCNVDYTVDISISDRIAIEHFRFISRTPFLEASRNLYRRLLAISKSLQYFFLEKLLWIQG